MTTTETKTLPTPAAEDADRVYIAEMMKEVETIRKSLSARAKDLEELEAYADQLSKAQSLPALITVLCNRAQLINGSIHRLIREDAEKVDKLEASISSMIAERRSGIYTKADVTQTEIDVSRRMDLQNEEFNKLEGLIQAYKTMTTVAVVDDDYPEVRLVYEQNLKDFIRALKNNGRL